MRKKGKNKTWEHAKKLFSKTEKSLGKSRSISFKTKAH